MSTESTSRRARTRRRRSRTFLGAVGIVVAALAVVGLAAAAVTTLQGPRVTDVQVDPDAAIEASGSRVIFTTTQSLADVDPSQVSVEPAADFTVDTSGRSVGVRFALPLWDETEYTVRIDDVTGVGGGSSSTIEETFTTPALSFQLLQRGEDAIYTSGLDGQASRAVTEKHIEDFRATASHLVLSTVDDEGLSRLLVTDLDGSDPRELPLPGDGMVSSLQSADRGDTIGFTYTDAAIDEDSGIESALYTISLREADAVPFRVTRGESESRVDDWRFVPGTDTILMLTFDGALTLVSPSGGDPVELGNAIAIDGIARGSTIAYIETIDGPAAIDLASAEPLTIAETSAEAGQTTRIVPVPGDTGATLRVLSRLDGFELLGTDLARVDASGTPTTIFSVAPQDNLIDVCVSPSGRYAAAVVAPDAVENPYDGYMLALPERLRTHIVQVADGTEVVALNGFDISWCQNPPRP